MAKPTETITFNVQPKQPWKIVLAVLGALLLISIFLNFRQCESKRDLVVSSEVERWQDTVRLKQAEISISDSLISRITKKSRDRALKDSLTVRALKGRVSILRIKLAELGQITPQEEADTTCARLITVSVLKDSVIARQDDLISTLELTHSATVKDLNDIIAIQDQKFKAQEAITAAREEQLSISQSETRKERRRKGFFKVTTAIGATLVAILVVKDTVEK